MATNKKDNKAESEVSPKIKQKILELWRTPSFSASFGGISNLQLALKLEKHIDISRQQLLDIMHSDPNFVLETRKIAKKIPRRKMNVHGFCATWQADLAFMFRENNFIGFLLCIDIFSRRIFCKTIKSKSSQEIELAFKKIFSQCNDKPDVLETDRGSEFVANKSFFKEQNIYFKYKTGKNKASFAEHAIFLVKRKLFRLMRILLTKDWPKYLSYIVRSLNNTPNKAIGGLKPSAIQSRKDTPLIDHRIGFHPDTSFEIQAEQQKKYEENATKLQVGSYVYVNYPATALEKSFNSPNYQLFIISRVDAGKRPTLYQVQDMLGTVRPGFFYREQLLKSTKPKAGFFHVEKILSKRKRNGKPEYLVKFLHYPPKFNSWVKEENLKKRVSG